VSSQNSSNNDVFPSNTPEKVTGKKCKQLWYDGVSNESRCYDLQTKLEKAIGKSNIEDIKEVIQEGANVNAGYDSSFPPLQFAVAFRDNKAVINLLLDNGANINQERNFGSTALTTAVYYEKVDIVKLLLERKANVCQRVEGQTSLEIAKVKNHKQLMEILTRFGGVNCSKKNL